MTTKYLNISEFGYIALFNMCILPFKIFADYGVGYVMYAKWFDFDKKERGELLISLLIVGSLMMLFSITIVLTFADLIFTFLFKNEWSFIKPLTIFLVISAISSVPQLIFQFWVVIEKRAKLNSILRVIEIILSASVTLIVVVHTQNYEFIIMGTVFVTGLISLFNLIFLIFNIQLKLDIKYFKLIFNIGWPIFFRSFFNHTRQQFDKIFVANLFGSGQFALYNLAGRFNQIIGEYKNNLEKAYQPFLFEGLSKNDVDLINFRKVFFSYGYMVLTISSLLILFGKQTLDLLTNGVFTEMYPLMLIYLCVLSLSLPFLGNGEVIIHNQKTNYLLKISIVQGILIIFLSFILIPRIGPEGGIISLWIGSLLLSIVNFKMKMSLFKELFIEKIMLGYVIYFHIIVILKYSNFNLLADILTACFLFTMSTHFFSINKDIIITYFQKILKKLNS